MEQTLEQYLLAEYQADELRDIAEHGCLAGFRGLTYYNDTTELFDKFEDDVWAKVDEYSTQMGEGNPIAFIGTLNGADNVSSTHTLKNLMVWFAVETWAQEFVNRADEGELKENSKGIYTNILLGV